MAGEQRLAPNYGFILPKVLGWLGLAASAWGWLAGAGWRLGAGGCPTNQKKMALEAARDRRKPFSPRGKRAQKYSIMKGRAKADTCMYMYTHIHMYIVTHIQRYRYTYHVMFQHRNKMRSKLRSYAKKGYPTKPFFSHRSP